MPARTNPIQRQPWLTKHALSTFKGLTSRQVGAVQSDLDHSAACAVGIEAQSTGQRAENLRRCKLNGHLHNYHRTASERSLMHHATQMIPYLGIGDAGSTLTPAIKRKNKNGCCPVSVSDFDLSAGGMGIFRPGPAALDLLLQATSRAIWLVT